MDETEKRLFYGDEYLNEEEEVNDGQDILPKDIMK